MRNALSKSLLVSLVLALVLALGLGAAHGEGEAISVTDVMGREVSITSSQRIISLTPSNTEIIYALGLGDRVVGVDSYSNYPEEAALLMPKCGDYSGPNIEVIISLEPDVIFAGNKLQSETVDQLAALGLTVIAAEGSTYAEIKDSINLIAAATQADAQPLLTQMADQEAMILDAVKDKEPVSVYYAVAFGEWGDYSVGPGSFVYEILEGLGANIVTSDSPVAWPEYSLEQIIEKNPEVILLGADEARAQAIYEEAGYKDLPAVIAGRVYAIDPDMASRPSPRVMIAMARMAEAVYSVSLPDIQ